jgi:uncharacterized membrane protein YccC
MSFNLTNPIHQRAIRTTIAVFIAVLLVHWIKIPHGDWVTVSAFIVSQDTIGNTVWKAKGRFWGTLSGAIAAVMVYGVIVQYHRLVLIIAFATIFPYLYLRPSMENYGYAKFFQQIALICFLSIIGENPSAGVMEWRAADIAIGCVVGVFVALVVFPTWAYPRWKKAQQTAWQDLQTWFEAIVAEYQSHGFDQHRL